MTFPNSNRILLGPRKNRNKKNRKKDAHLKTEIGQALWRLKCSICTVKAAKDAGIEALEIFNRDVGDAQLALINARLKLKSDLHNARVEVVHAMGVHTRAKAALMAARESGVERDFVVSRTALTKAQKVYARIVRLLIECAKADRRNASWIHRCSGDAAFAARNEGLKEARIQLYDDETNSARQALRMAHFEVTGLDVKFTLLNVKNLLMKLSDVFLSLANLVARHGADFIQKRVSRIERNVAKILKALKLELAKIPFVFDTIAPGQLFPAESADHDAKQQLYLDLSSHWARTAEGSTMPWRNASV